MSKPIPYKNIKKMKLKGKDNGKKAMSTHMTITMTMILTLTK